MDVCSGGDVVPFCWGWASYLKAGRQWQKCQLFWCADLSVPWESAWVSAFLVGPRHCAVIRCCSCPCTCGEMKEEIQDGDVLWLLAFKAVRLMTRWQRAGWFSQSKILIFPGWVQTSVCFGPQPRKVFKTMTILWMGEKGVIVPGRISCTPVALRLCLIPFHIRGSLVQHVCVVNLHSSLCLDMYTFVCLASGNIWGCMCYDRHVFYPV